MKIKQYLHITDREAFLRGHFDSCFTLLGHESGVSEWTVCGELEIDVDVDTGEMIDQVTEQIDRTISEMQTAISVAKARKAELLALPAPGTDPCPECDTPLEWDSDIGRDYCPSCGYPEIQTDKWDHIEDEVMNER